MSLLSWRISRVQEKYERCVGKKGKTHRRCKRLKKRLSRLKKRQQARSKRKAAKGWSPETSALTSAAPAASISAQQGQPGVQPTAVSTYSEDYVDVDSEGGLSVAAAGGILLSLAVVTGIGVWAVKRKSGKKAKKAKK